MTLRRVSIARISRLHCSRKLCDAGVKPMPKYVASDSGASTTDDVTNVGSPVFDVISTDTYFRFYRDGAHISGNYETGATYTAAGEPAGRRCCAAINSPIFSA